MSKRKQAYWLSDAEWAAIEPHLPRGRSVVHPDRVLLGDIVLQALWKQRPLTPILTAPKPAQRLRCFAVFTQPPPLADIPNVRFRAAAYRPAASPLRP
jgi:hypothetical protein